MLYPLRQLVPMGAEHSTLDATVERTANQMGIELAPDPFPEEVFFVRSDQYSFVRRGVPSLFLFMGLQSDSGIDAAARFREWGRTRYHTPQDDLGQPMDLNAGARHAQLVFLTGLEIANAEERPAWKPGDFFGRTFGRATPGLGARIPWAPARTRGQVSLSAAWSGVSLPRSSSRGFAAIRTPNAARMKRSSRSIHRGAGGARGDTDWVAHSHQALSTEAVASRIALVRSLPEDDVSPSRALHATPSRGTDRWADGPADTDIWAKPGSGTQFHGVSPWRTTTLWSRPGPVSAPLPQRRA